jgi:hypothetical protein
MPRPLLEPIPTLGSGSKKDFLAFLQYKEDGVLTFGSFGFGFLNKGFHRVIEMVNRQYDKAVIKLLITRGHYVPDAFTTEALAACKQVPCKEGIHVMIYEDFVEEEELLFFLQQNDMNLFLYDRMEGRGISSTIDYALSARKPLGISDSDMFRHIYADAICVHKTSLEECRKASTGYCSKFLEMHSHANLVQKVVSVLLQ